MDIALSVCECVRVPLNQSGDSLRDHGWSITGNKQCRCLEPFIWNSFMRSAVTGSAHLPSYPGHGELCGYSRVEESPDTCSEKTHSFVRSRKGVEVNI